MVQADLTDLASLPPAFAGASAIFLNTDFWVSFYPAKAALEVEGKDITPASQIAFDFETMCGKNAAVAAAGVPTLERIVVSGLGSVATDGKYTRSLHPESKDWIVRYIEREQPELAKKMSIILLGAYNTNRLLAPTRDKESGVYKFFSPVHEKTHLPTIDPQNSTGPFVRELIQTEGPGTKLLAYDSNLTVAEIVETWSQATGKKGVFVPVTTQQLHMMGGLWEHLDAVDYLNEHDAYENKLPGFIRPHQLTTKVETKSLEQWIKTQDWDEAD